ncbi:MAG: B12-binding domain-containing radical SAM protein [Burkholderiaceae bacterium]|jgi:radical SAM superfamily enzyme YgiQ (UPF0313 family)|nr:B12-binding domain-containing radical SAM protein [Burkholderiaceae bacterium]
MRLTIVHPAIGHRRGESYIRTWQMEPLPAAAIAGLTPPDVALRFYDDRMEAIPYDESTDAVALSLETYTARRAYQIASEYRRRGVPVIMGGFHATLCPEEAERHAEAVVLGEAEGIWPQVIDDLRHGTLQKRYRAEGRPDLSAIRIDRRIFAGKRYLPIRLIETGRGCRFPCDFCAIQTFFGRTHRARPPQDILHEIETLKSDSRVFFFVDDNFAGNMALMRELLPPLARQRVRWITQMSINAAHDEGFLAQLAAAGCQGVLIGFESLNEANLRAMNKRFNTMRGGYTAALGNLRRHGIRVYGTFVFGYDHDTPEAFAEAVDFAIGQRMYIAAFNHLTPFPGTPLYQRLQGEGRLLYQAWWLDAAYRYNEVPFTPARLTPSQITEHCVAARRRFYGLPSIVRRGLSPSNRGNAFMWRNYWPINLMHRADIGGRNGYPLGDETWQGTLLEAAR